MSTATVSGIKTVLHPVSDLERAKAMYAALLGIAPQTDSPYYVGFDIEGQHIGLLPGGGPAAYAAPVPFWHVADIDAALAAALATGATVKEPVNAVSETRKVATIIDPDGNVVGLLQDC